MGIHGLWKTVHARYGRSLHSFVEVIDFGATLLVDASSFLFHLLNQQIPTIYKRYSFPRECGGCYRLIDEVIRLEIKRLREQLGFGRVIFYFDGPVSYYKQDTKEKRSERIPAEWELVYKISVGLARSSDINPSQLPLPPLAFRVLNTVLKDLNVSIVSCPAEADQQMAIDCQRMNQSQIDGKTVAYCYSSDSDYLIMKDIPLIALGSLDDEGELSLKIVVWRRSKIAKLFSCSEDMLVKWAILIGNDYTSEFEKSKFHPSLSDDEFISCEKMLYWLRDHYDEDKEQEEDEAQMPFRISKIAEEPLRLACEYSYLFYELEDLSHLCTEEYETVDLSDGSECEDGILMQWVHEEAIEDWLSIKQASNIDKETLASLTVSFLQDCVQRNHDQKSAQVESSSEENLDLGNIFSMDHIDVIIEMIEELAKNSYLSFKPTLLIQWEDVLAGNYYQLIAKEIFSAHSSLPEKPLSFQPLFLYDGLLFHHLLQKRRVARDQVETETSHASVTNNVPVDKEKKDVLPIDEYREEILARIDRSRVVVLSGETGCGKSTRVPIFIYEQAKEKRKKCRIIICQPRRIACVNLKNRLQEKFGDKVGLRMGHGVREESAKTQILFVTSGYLVRLLAHHPHSLDSITHLIIDEVHERSVDNDLLCYLLKRNISHYKKLHLILMSATVQTTLYQDYFNDRPNIEDDLIVEDAISVGVRRFPVETVYMEGVMKAIGAKEKLLEKKCQEVIEIVEGILAVEHPQGYMVPTRLRKAQFDVCVALVHKVGKGGSGILIFVSGMSDILELQSRFEVPGGGSGIYKVIGIHSEIPFEDQLEAFKSPQRGEIKIIIATNAAESSVTLPNVDVVICLGTHKAVSLQASNTASNKKKDIERSVLTNVWISKSSAIQRAGRTGRIRPGKVYRLYSEELYEKAFIAHESAEIHRKPLYEVIITLKCIFEDDPSTTSSSASLKQNGKGKGGKSALLPPITTMRDILENLIESVSPDLIDAALSFLYYQQILTSPSDTADSKLTSLGLFTAQSSTDLTLSKLMIYGITLGVGIESIIIAAALSQPKTVFRIAHPSIHKDPDEFNSIIAQTFLASVILDDGSYSDALMMVRLFVVWHYLTVEEAKAVMNKYGIVNARIRHFISSVKHLVRRCSESNGSLRECLDVDTFLHNSFLLEPSEENDELITLSDASSWQIASTRKNHIGNLMRKKNFKEKDIDLKLEDYVKRVVLSEETVMKIRLIFLWTFNHNLLTTKPKNKREKEEIAIVEEGRSLEINKSNGIPIHDFLKYFPSTNFSSSLLKKYGLNGSENVVKVIEGGKYHYRFDLKTSFQQLLTSETTIPAFHDTLVRSMISLWRQSQNEHHFLPLHEKIPKNNKKEGKKEKSSQHLNNVHFLQHITQIVMQDIEEVNKESKKKHKRSSKKSSATSSSTFVYSIRIAVFLNYRDIQILQRTRPLLQSLMKLLKRYQPVVSTESIFSEHIDADEEEKEDEEVREDAEICYFQLNNLQIPTIELDYLYQFLLEYSGIIQILSPNEKEEDDEASLSTTSKITMVNWKPSRSFLINCLTQLDSNTLWSEDLNFHHSYDRVNGQDLRYNILLPQHFVQPSESNSGGKFCDSSDYRRLFRAFARPQLKRKMLVAITPNEDDEKIIEEERKKAVPGSEAWAKLKEAEKKENAEDEITGIDKQIIEVQIKTSPSNWNIIGQLHLKDDHEETEQFTDFVDLTKAPWQSAILSHRGPISTSRIHVEREVLKSSYSGKVVKSVEKVVYGVCYSAVAIAKPGGEEAFIVCEGVTLFPSRDWVRWELLCSGYLIESQTEDDEETTLRKLMICRDVFEHLKSLKNHRVEEKEEIIELLEHLFD